MALVFHVFRTCITTINNSHDNPLRYRGYYFDNESGYYYLQSRYYDINTCRFINADESSVLELTKGQAVGHNLFAYCGNDPINNIDPDGHSFFSKIKNAVDAALRFILQVKHFGALIDTLLSVIPAVAGFMSSLKAARAAKALAASSKAVLERSRKVILEFMKNELIPKLDKYAKKKVTSLIAGILPSIVNGLLAAASTSVGTVIAKLIDKYDNDRNNGYVFYKT